MHMTHMGTQFELLWQQLDITGYRENKDFSAKKGESSRNEGMLVCSMWFENAFNLDEISNI